MVCLIQFIITTDKCRMSNFQKHLPQPLHKNMIFVYFSSLHLFFLFFWVMFIMTVKQHKTSTQMLHINVSRLIHCNKPLNGSTRTGSVGLCVICIEEITVGDIFFSNEASLEMLSAVQNHCVNNAWQCQTTQVEKVRGMAGKNKQIKRGVVDHLLLLPVPWVSLLPDGGENIGSYSGPENCACCSLVASLPCCSLRRDSTHGISHTERHLPQKKKKRCVHICTCLSLQTDAQVQTQSRFLSKLQPNYSTSIFSFSCVNKERKLRSSLETRCQRCRLRVTSLFSCFGE